MTWIEIEKKLSDWMPAIYLERTISHSIRRRLNKTFLFLSVLSFVFSSGLFFQVYDRLTALFFLFLFSWILTVMAEAFFYSYFFKSSNREIFTFELASVVSKTGGDLTGGFCKSGFGKIIIQRLGIDQESLKGFLKNRQKIISPNEVVFKDSNELMDSYLRALFSADKEFGAFLMSHGATEEIFVSCSKWILRSLRLSIDSERWWSEKKLSLTKGLGRDWSYGQTYFLSKWSSPLYLSVSADSAYHLEEAKILETILLKNREANALIIGEEGAGKIEVIETMLQSMKRGGFPPGLKDKKFVVLDTGGFVSLLSDKESFEESLMKLLSEASSAGNIVLIIPNFPALLHSASALEVDLPTLMDRFLVSSNLQVIATSNTQGFHSTIEKNRVLLERFDTLMVQSSDGSEILSLLESDIFKLEHSERVFFTYQAIFEAVKGAERYFVGEPIFDKSLDLLSQAGAFAKNAGRNVVLKEDVSGLIRSKTGVPMGEVSSAEQEKLSRLEELLHDRVIGQNEAISAISNALRRSRAGIGNPNRPIGSFLFLGPTGVGKTETTKALAEIFFGTSSKEKGRILRLDMSEYNSPDALNKLIGYSGMEGGGILSSMIRENPYGVLLLDEFEKTNSKVMDLFLQILDEGIFSDSVGRKVSARNLIIVATSNAGSDLIFETIKNGESLDGKKETIVEEIIQRGIYRPELLNRFDGIILFHPLEESHLRDVAKLMLEKLSFRLKSQGISLAINEPLINFLVSHGNDPKFGARALNRALQDTIEKVIADKILSGNIRPGSEIVLTSEDLKLF